MLRVSTHNQVGGNHKRQYNKTVLKKLFHRLLLRSDKMVDFNEFKQENECFYKDERYSVRDNGAVLRFPLDIRRPRPTDNKWTFGKLNRKTGYLEIASVRVHRIVATAFHREPPTKEHVVDHIDTNKQNNRPDNLRWATKLENVLLNPITVKRIETVCGCSVEEFLSDPSKFRNKFQEPNYEWMCTVSIQEAQASKERLLAWAKSDKQLQGGVLGRWIFNADRPLQGETLRKWPFNRNNKVRKKTEKERIIEEQIISSKTNEMIEQVFVKVKKITGLSQEELSSKTKKVNI